jgi:hypothetical protein
MVKAHLGFSDTDIAKIPAEKLGLLVFQVFLQTRPGLPPITKVLETFGGPRHLMVCLSKAGK